MHIYNSNRKSRLDISIYMITIVLMACSTNVHAVDGLDCVDLTVVRSDAVLDLNTGIGTGVASVLVDGIPDTVNAVAAPIKAPEFLPDGSIEMTLVEVDTFTNGNQLTAIDKVTFTPSQFGAFMTITIRTTWYNGNGGFSDTFGRYDGTGVYIPATSTLIHGGAGTLCSYSTPW